ncbi:unnamed protein product, partial [Rotaria sp. Silwood2]
NLTDKEINILENGLNFVLPDKEFDEMTFISNIETCFVNLLGHCTEKKDYEEKDIDEPITYNLTPVQLQFASKIRSICNNFRFNTEKIINKHKQDFVQFDKVLKSLSNDKSIQITKPDKGKGIVIMDKEDYNKKMLEILSDHKTFKILKFNETMSHEDRLIRKLKHLKNNGFITEKEYNFCRPTGSQPARIYGLPKIHKIGVPLRPIVSASGTFNYNLAKLLASKLDHLRKNDTIITNTFAFVEELLALEFDNSQIKMVSFDITSLFTNVPLQRTIQIILDKLYGPEHTCTYSDKKRDDWCQKCKNRFEMKYLLDTSTEDTNFIFNNKIYSQINGVAMGSPLGPVFADIYVNYLESKLMSRLKNNGLLYLRRFVDDTFAIIKKDADINKIIDILNSFDNCIVFTCEEEVNNSLPFLDIYITRLPTNIPTNNLNNILSNNSTNNISTNNLSNSLNNNLNNKSFNNSTISSNNRSSNILNYKSSYNSSNKSSNNSINNSTNNLNNKSSNNSTISSNNKSSNILNYKSFYNPNNKLSNNTIKNFINNLNNKTAVNLTISSNNKSLNSSTVNSNNIVFNNSTNNLSTKSVNISNVASTINSINNLINLPTISSTKNSTQNSSKSFATTIYRKPTYTGLITKWSSFVPHTYKVSTISSMVYRAIRICSSYDLMHEQFEFIEFIGIENGYPEGFIKAQIRKTLGRYFDKINGTQIYKSKNKTNNDKDNSIKREQVFIDIPFFGKPTVILGKRLINLAKSINPQIHIQPIQRPSSSISKYFPTKDPIPKLLRSNIVYKLDCSNCESSYIGKTIRQTYRRLQEHGANFVKEKENKSQSLDKIDNSNNLRRSDRNKGKIVQYFPKIQNESIDFQQNNLTHSAVKQHEINNNHKIDWENFNIIAKDNKHYRLLVKESLLICKSEPTLNKTVCSVPLIIYPEGLTNKPKVKIKSTIDALPKGGESVL